MPKLWQSPKGKNRLSRSKKAGNSTPKYPSPPLPKKQPFCKTNLKTNFPILKLISRRMGDKTIPQNLTISRRMGKHENIVKAWGPWMITDFTQTIHGCHDDGTLLHQCTEKPKKQWGNRDARWWRHIMLGWSLISYRLYTGNSWVASGSMKPLISSAIIAVCYNSGRG